MAIKLQWVASAYDLRPGDVFRPELDEDCRCFEVLSHVITPERCIIRARKLNTSVEQDFTWNSPSYRVILSTRTLFDRFRLHEINAWAIKENKPPIPLREDV